MRTRRQTGRVLPFVLSLLAVLSACSDDDAPRVDNLRPNVRLTGGPVEGDSVSYTSEIFWTGWDQDGVVDHYQYAIDIPSEFSLDDINSPEDRGIAWRDTTAFRARFHFRTPLQDSIQLSNNTVELPERYRGDHTFYVRAVDNEGAVSDADFLTFTARTVTPRTRLVIPRVARNVNILEVGRQMSVAWEGIDPDSPDPRGRPAWYEWKLVPVPTVIVVEDPVYALNVTGAHIPWERVGSDTTFLRVPLDPPQDYVFGVRAIDEAGGVENRFFWGQNALKIASSNRYPGTPTLTIREVSIGTVIFPDAGATVEFEVPVNQPLVFEFSADADAYGGVIQGYNYGIDVVDADDDGPNSGFRGWSLIPYTFPPIRFTRPGVHTITFKCRDTGGGVTIGTFLIRVIAFPKDRDVLYVDDYRLFRSGAVTDALMDERAVAMLEDAGFGEVFQVDTWGGGDGTNEPLLIRLSQLGRYKVVVWSVLGSGYAGNTSLVRMNACPRDKLLQAYVSAGGAVLIQGQQVFGSFEPFRPDNCIANVTYSRSQGLFFDVGRFPCDYLHLCGGDIRNVRDNTKVDGLSRAEPTREAADELFPTVEVDSTIFNWSAIGGLPLVDAMFQPTFDTSGGLDTLYTLVSARFVSTGESSAFNRRPVAFRYFDPDPQSEQGPVAVFGFPFHLLKPGSAAERTGVHGLMRSMREWFESHQRGTTP